MPTYRIDRPGSDLPRVVVAAQPQAARLHVANDELTVRRIEVDEAFALAEQGVKLERAGEIEHQQIGDEEEQQQSGEAQDAAQGNEDDAKSDLGQQEQTPTDELRRNGTDEGREPFDAGDEELEGN